MVTIQKVQQGLVQYIDDEIMPHFTGIKKIGLGVYVALAAKNAENAVRLAQKNPAIQMLGIFDESGNVDIDAIYKAAYPMFANGEKVPIEIPVLGEIRLDQSDLEKIYHYVKD